MDATHEYEEWRPVVGWESKYEVSNLGRIRSIPRVVRGGRGSHRNVPQTIRKQFPTNSGYMIVGLSNGQNSRSRLVHVLVLEAFVGPRPSDMEACHFDGDKTNNVLSNLRWDKKRNNNLDAVRVGTRPDPDRKRCIRGHELNPETIHYNVHGRRECKTCKDFVGARYRDEVMAGRRTVKHRYPGRSECRRGHSLTADNVYVDPYGRRVCRRCVQISREKHKARKRATES